MSVADRKMTIRSTTDEGGVGDLPSAVGRSARTVTVGPISH
jgi:hypothetical protein